MWTEKPKSSRVQDVYILTELYTTCGRCCLSISDTREPESSVGKNGNKGKQIRILNEAG